LSLNNGWISFIVNPNHELQRDHLRAAIETLRGKIHGIDARELQQKDSGWANIDSGYLQINLGSND
jgi:hypothetical protein